MRKSHFWKIATGTAIILALGSASANAQESIRNFTPSGNWVLDPREDSCAIARNYESNGQSLTVVFEQVLPGTHFNAFIVSYDLPMPNQSLSFRFEPDDQFRNANPIRTRVTSQGQHVAAFSATLVPSAQEQSGENPRLDWTDENRDAREQAIIGMSLNGLFAEPVHIASGSMGEPMTALRSCFADLLSSWGMALEPSSNVTHPPVRNSFQTWAARINEAYPSSMVSQRRGATVHVNVLVGEDGRVRACHAHNPEPYPDFEEAACGGMMRYARYDPAKDAQGQSVASRDAMTIVYFLR